VSDVEVVKQLIEEANHRRSVGSTAANSDSSRSHSIMQFALKRPIAPQPHNRLASPTPNWMLVCACAMQCNARLCCVKTCQEGSVCPLGRWHGAMSSRKLITLY
jgi:Kinesin motor domain